MDSEIRTDSPLAEGDPEHSPSRLGWVGCALVVVVFLLVIYGGVSRVQTSTSSTSTVRTVQPFPGVTLHKPAQNMARLANPPPQSLSEDITLATWEERHTPTMKFKNNLVYRKGTVVLRTQYDDGSSSVQEVVERPTDAPDERRFDLEPDSDRSEYITLTDSGVVKYFDWAGQQFMSAFTTTLHVDFLVVGTSPVSLDCVPKTLSATSKKIVDLYEQLQILKEDEEFAVSGFAGAYRVWLEAVERLHAESSPAESLDELGFLAGDVMTLGLDYVNAGESASSRKAQELEQTIEAGLTIATCANAPLREEGPVPR